MYNIIARELFSFVETINQTSVLQFEKRLIILVTNNIIIIVKIIKIAFFNLYRAKTNVFFRIILYDVYNIHQKLLFFFFEFFFT